MTKSDREKEKLIKNNIIELFKTSEYNKHCNDNFIAELLFDNIFKKIKFNIDTVFSFEEFIDYNLKRIIARKISSVFRNRNRAMQYLSMNDNSLRKSTGSLIKIEELLNWDIEDIYYVNKGVESSVLASMLFINTTFNFLMSSKFEKLLSFHLKSLYDIYVLYHND